MKTTCWHFAVLLMTIAAAVRADDPPDLVQARNAYEAQARAATEQIRQRYLIQLEAMKQQHTARGNGDAVVSLQNEINKIRAEAGLPSTFDWQRLRTSASYSYRDPHTFAKSGSYTDDAATKLFDRHIGQTFSAKSVGWDGVRPSPILVKFTRPLMPVSLRLYVLGSDVGGGVEMIDAVKIYNDAKPPRGELIATLTKIPDRSGWIEIPLSLKTPTDRLRLEIDPAKSGWTILEELEFR